MVFGSGVSVCVCVCVCVRDDTMVYDCRHVSAVPILGLQEVGDAAVRWDEAVAGRSTELKLHGYCRN